MVWTFGNEPAQNKYILSCGVKQMDVKIHDVNLPCDELVTSPHTVHTHVFCACELRKGDG